MERAYICACAREALKATDIFAQTPKRFPASRLSNFCDAYVECRICLKCVEEIYNCVIDRLVCEHV